MSAPTDAPLAGRYRLLRRLGSGGVATVFLAEDERLARPVAIKRLHAHGAEDMARRFEREARIGAALNHPSLVSVYDITADAEEVVIVMEYVEGRTLADALRDGGLERVRTVEIVRDVAAGLDHAHAQGVVHRDVKPANVLLGEDGRVKLADLGIAVAAEATSITRTGTVLGTPAYMAPEQLEGREPGPAVDVYALAAVTFEALTGRRAREGRTPLEVAHQVVNEPPPDVREAWPEAPPALAEALREGMSQDPEARPSSAGELAERLATAVTEVSESRPSGGPAAVAAPVAPAGEPAAEQRAPAEAGAEGSAGTRAPGVTRWAALAAVLLVGGGLLAVLLATGGDEPAPQPAADRPAGESAQGGGGSSDSGTGAGRGAAESPDEAVTSFYGFSAAGDYGASWALATPNFRRQLGGRAAFEQSQSTLESIEFERADVVSESDGSAEVAIETVATHTDGVDRCEGTVNLVAGGDGGWLIDGASIACPESTRS